MFLKVLKCLNDVKTAESLYEGERYHITRDGSDGRWMITVESATGAVSLELAADAVYYVMNDRGDTLDSFRGDRHTGSPERDRRVEAASRPIPATIQTGLSPDAG